MNQPLIFGFYGLSNSGKTHAMTTLIHNLTSKGYRIAAVKFTDKSLSLDTRGKDTWKYKEAGASLVVLSTSLEDTLMMKTIPWKDMVHSISCLSFFDVILVEGAHDESIPKFRFGEIEVRNNTIASFQGDIGSLEDIILNDLIKKRKDKEEGEMNTTIMLKVNGKDIPLSEFPSEIITNTVLGMIRSLKGFDEIHEVELHIEL
jgi:molybdopterin-guanine dinucleotide biosynthesis protein B